jgi:S-adenosylmethionine decarboxylase
MHGGTEYLIDAAGCSLECLRDLATLRDLCQSIITDLDLCVIGQPIWHPFPGPGGVTGLYLLTESHLACHTYPETGVATFNLYCCRRRPRWPWEDRLRERLGAQGVTVRAIERGGEGGRP